MHNNDIIQVGMDSRLEYWKNRIDIMNRSEQEFCGITRNILCHVAIVTLIT